MTSRLTISWKPLLVALIPAFLIVSGAGIIAIPNFKQLRELQNERSRIDATLAEAERIRPMLAQFRSKGEAGVETVGQWLDLRLPKSATPRIVMSDIFLAQIASGVTVLRLQPATSEIRNEEDAQETDLESKASLWRLTLEGSYTQIIAMLHVLRDTDAMYLPRTFLISRGRKGTLHAELTFLTPWLPVDALYSHGVDR